MADEYIVEMRHITKRFPGIVANDDISLGIKKGEIFALLGENGGTFIIDKFHHNPIPDVCRWKSL